ncbi:F-box domain-containing protein [Pandoravirus kuranda]|uniref:F-box domain-containing protein n=1 Tax=Pandoravirus kuranda TaxID=3019033 RepID=A0AA95EE84_9VIRU|nr:F-box domain-containing protein [Pandoravirus kuranda]
MGSSQSDTRKSLLCAYYVAAASRDRNVLSRSLRGAGQGGQQRHADVDGPCHLVGLPNEVLTDVFASLPPLQAAVALARCGATCRRLRDFCQPELRRALARSLECEAASMARPDDAAKTRCVSGLQSTDRIPKACIAVLAPVVGGLCAIPLTVVKTDGTCLSVAEGGRAIRTWYAARVTEDDMAYVGDSLWRLYGHYGEYRLCEALVPLIKAGVTPARVRERDMRSAQSLGGAPPEWLKRNMRLVSAQPLCAHQRLLPWLYTGEDDRDNNDYEPPVCPKPDTCPRARVMVLKPYARPVIGKRNYKYDDEAADAFFAEANRQAHA